MIFVDIIENPSCGKTLYKSFIIVWIEVFSCL